MGNDLWRNFLCETQGRLFANAVIDGYDGESFIDCFMNDELAARIDSPYDDAQWRGEGYLLEDLVARKRVPQGSEKDWRSDAMFWVGYLYRWWQQTRGTASSEIVKIAPPRETLEAWYGLHTLDFDEAVNELIEIHTEKKPPARKGKTLCLAR